MLGGVGRVPSIARKSHPTPNGRLGVGTLSVTSAGQGQPACRHAGRRRRVRAQRSLLDRDEQRGAHGHGHGGGRDVGCGITFKTFGQVRRGHTGACPYCLGDVATPAGGAVPSTPTAATVLLLCQRHPTSRPRLAPTPSTRFAIHSRCIASCRHLLSGFPLSSSQCCCRGTPRVTRHACPFSKPLQQAPSARPRGGRRSLHTIVSPSSCHRCALVG